MDPICLTSVQREYVVCISPHLTDIAYMQVYCAMYIGSIVSVCKCSLTFSYNLHKAKDCT